MLSAVFALILAVGLSSDSNGGSSTQANAIKPCLSEGRSRPSWFNSWSQATAAPLHQLRTGSWVARTAEQWIESEDRLTQVATLHNFKEGTHKIQCATLREPLQRNFSTFAPLILDRSVPPTQGTTFWQFQLTLLGAKVGLWNQKSHLMTETKFRHLGEEVQWRWLEDGGGRLILLREYRSERYLHAMMIELERAPIRSPSGSEQSPRRESLDW